MKGNPEFTKEPFWSLVNGRLFEAKDPIKINDYTRSAQELLKSRYCFMLAEFEKINKIDILSSIRRERITKRLFRSKSLDCGILGIRYRYQHFLDKT